MMISSYKNIVNIKCKIMVSIIMMIFVPLVSYSQTYEYKSIKNTYGKYIDKPNVEFVEVAKYLPKKFVCDGSEDYTYYIQKAIDENKNVVLPNFPILINDTGVKLRSNSKVFFDRKSKLILKPSAKERYNMLLIKRAKDVQIFNPVLVGDRDYHKGVKGQWGHGIGIEDSENIEILNVDISNTWGDGIYLRPTKNNVGGNIYIKYGAIDNARRNGISIISAEGLVIDSIQISNSNGHNPASGIDVEPNRKHIHSIIDVNLKNIFTYNNERDGIVISLGNLIGSNVGEFVTLTILNHKDENSRLGLLFPKAHSAKVTNKDKPLKGKITIENESWFNTRTKRPINIRSANTHMPQTTMKNFYTNNMDAEELSRRIQNMIKPLKQFKYIEN